MKRICLKCAVPHFENCNTCFGFGIKTNLSGEQLPVNATRATEMREACIVIPELSPCPECGSTIEGIPDLILIFTIQVGKTLWGRAVKVTKKEVSQLKFVDTIIKQVITTMSLGLTNESTIIKFLEKMDDGDDLVISLEYARDLIFQETYENCNRPELENKLLDVHQRLIEFQQTLDFIVG